ncbi:MAG: ATP-dependent helicase RecQ [Flaviaesturariibacter sp.]|nr:ATP-dependent helicase RecQ [Flaviaesturariibacter sp.]
MIAYAKTNSCRSLFINHYFGDADESPCGICDSCLQRKEKPLSGDELTAVESRIGDLLLAGPMAPGELVGNLAGIPKSKAWQAITFLQGENRLMVDEKGRVSLPRPKP